MTHSPALGRSSRDPTAGAAPPPRPRAARGGGRAGGAAGWVALAGGLLSWLGFHWDIAWHTELGRDRFLTPPHALILVGYVVTLAAVELDLRDPGRRATGALRWLLRRPGLLVVSASTITSMFVLAFDNAWHGMFGFDITLWSPPHLLLSVSFVLIVLGALVDLAQALRRAPCILAAGLVYAVTSLLLFEFDLGVPHRSMLFELPVLGAVFGLALGVASGARSRLRGTAFAVAALGWRLVAALVNVVVGVSVPLLPLGLVAGGLAFDALCWLMGRGQRVVTRATTLAAGLAGWAAFVATSALWRRAVGRTWWTAEVVGPGALLGAAVVVMALLAGTVVAAILHRAAAPEAGAMSEPDVDSVRRLLSWLFGGDRLRPLVTGTVGLAGLVGLSAVPILRGTHATLEADLTRPDDRVAVQIAGADGDDWVSLLGGRPETPRRATFLDPLPWKGGAFEGPAPERPLAWEGVWYARGNEVWFSRHPPGTEGRILLQRDAFRPVATVQPLDEARSYLMVLVLVAAQWAALVFLRFWPLGAARDAAGDPIGDRPERSSA